MVSKTHTMTLGTSKNKNSHIAEPSFVTEQEQNLPYFL